MALKGPRVPGEKVPSLLSSPSPLAMAGLYVRLVCPTIHVTSREQAPELNFARLHGIVERTAVEDQRHSNSLGLSHSPVFSQCWRWN